MQETFWEAVWKGFFTNVSSAVIVALLAGGALLLFWGRVKQRLLVDGNRIPLVEFDHTGQVVRNIGTETAVNGCLYHIIIREFRKAEVRFVTSLPNLMSGEAQKVVALTDCGVTYWELFLLQYNNATGATFQALIEPPSPADTPQVMYPPHRLTCLQSKQRFEPVPDCDPSARWPLKLRRWMKRDFELRLVDKRRLRKLRKQWNLMRASLQVDNDGEGDSPSSD